MFKPRTVAQHVHHHRKNVVRFMIRRMSFEEIDMIVDSIGQSDMLGKLEHSSDTGIIDCLGSIG